MKAKLTKGVTLTQIEGKTVLFSLKSGDTFGLNDSAALFVKQLLASDFDAAVKACATEFEAPEAEVRGDMQEILDDLVAQKLLERA